MKTIRQFQGEYRFLSNFWPCRVFLDGEEYASVEHAYQASKTESKIIRHAIQKCRTPGEAKRAVRKYKLQRKQNAEETMMLVEQKFNRHLNPGLYEKLKATGRAVLEEGNTWGDTFWGVSPPGGKGRNALGGILMAVRDLGERNIRYAK